MKRLLNVGGGSKSLPIPAYFADFQHELLDVNPSGQPDIVLDARELTTLPAESYDAVFCSHNLEHYYRHDGVRVLRGVLHVLKPEGFVEIRVPDLEYVFNEVANRKLDVDDVLYQAPVGPIRVSDVLFGYQAEIEQSGRDFYAHRTGFTKSSLARFVSPVGFPYFAVGNNSDATEIIGYFFRQPPTDRQRQLIGAPLV